MGFVRTDRLVAMALAVVLLTAVGALALEHLDGSDEHDREWAQHTLLMWTSGGLAEGLPDRIRTVDGIDAVSVVRGDLVGLTGSWDADGQPVDTPADGFRIPLDALAVDPASHAAVLPAGERAPIANLQEGQALLSERSARLRGLGPGASLQLHEGPRVTVAEVVADHVVGHAELVVHASTPGVQQERFVLVSHDGDRDRVEDGIRAAAGDKPARVRAPDEVGFLRHGGTVLPQVAVKERFGEFSYRPAQGRMIEQDAAWVDEHIVGAHVPVLGAVVCHRQLLPAVEGAMTELAEAGLAHTVDPAEYAGCYGPRLIAPGQSLSRHAWGAAIDLNADSNPLGAAASMDPRLVEVMTRWGFTWGGEWMLPDAMHFEYESDTR